MKTYEATFTEKEEMKTYEVTFTMRVAYIKRAKTQEEAEREAIDDFQFDFFTTFDPDCDEIVTEEVEGIE